MWSNATFIAENSSVLAVSSVSTKVEWLRTGSLVALYMSKRPWGEVVKEIALDSFSISSLVSFPTGLFCLCRACHYFQHGFAGVEGSNQLRIIQTGN